ncbi:endosomal/lysosomal potassium channel TMEM175-like [Lingula anatina]|uniref:Endosomal/lysosomal proton channel TMEM175 n=1 Tax=Lingula anatina TaxID=7574 RepID=A0A1S3HLQ0_LINAN|nr:endosomal/lysosomal potassium channel TMEM175-like [Lingula anatina]|eukprot:XP_013386396.1 endosomal/lysosomal potassium channel TMEM175-like [Lingula anatina]
MDSSVSSFENRVPSSGRVAAYSDAVFSIIATVMILPVTHTVIPENKDLRSTLIRLIPNITVYIVSYLIVSGIWISHVWLFETIQRADEVVLFLNLALLMVVTFTPFVFTLLGQFSESMEYLEKYDVLPVVLFAATFMCLFGIQIVLIYYVFKVERIMKVEVVQNEDKMQQRNAMLWGAGIPMILCILAIICAPFSPLVGLIVLALIVASGAIRKWAYKIYEKYRGNRDSSMLLHINVRHRLLKEVVNKERVECFSDGVFAIVATLIILDICEDDIPTIDDVRKFGTVSAALSQHSNIYVAYAATFIAVGLLWSMHHTLLHYMMNMNRLMVFFNNLALACIGLSPLAFKMTTAFEDHKYGNNSMTAVQFNTAILFLAAIFQVAVWVTALFHQNVHVTQEAAYSGRDHAYITIKLSIFPLLSLLIYFMSFASEAISVTVFNAMLLGSPALFLLLRVLYPQCTKFCSRRRNAHQAALSIIRQEVPPQLFGDN